MQRVEAAGYCERFCMKWRWRKSDFEIGSCVAMRKRTHASDRDRQDLESDSIPRVSWKLEAGGTVGASGERASSGTLRQPRQSIR